jgi:hypothetical protein
MIKTPQKRQSSRIFFLREYHKLPQMKDVPSTKPRRRQPTWLRFLSPSIGRCGFKEIIFFDQIQGWGLWRIFKIQERSSVQAPAQTEEDWGGWGRNFCFHPPHFSPLFKGGLFPFRVSFSEERPFKPLALQYPKVNPDGLLALQLLCERWSPKETVQTTLFLVSFLWDYFLAGFMNWASS